MMLGDYTENSSIVTDNMAAMEDNKLNIEETTLNLSSIKKELDEEMIDYEEISGVKRLKTDPAGNVIGESSYKIELKEEGDNLIDYPENVVTESEFVTLRSVKEEEEDENSDYFYCNRCNGNYDGYCLKCSTLSHILNNRVRFTYSQSEVNTTPSDILEIKETSIGKGVFLIKTLPKNVIFGPFEGILGIESTGGHSWKIKNRKLLNIENSNWMKDIACAVNALFKNLDIFQFGGNLYYKTNREIIEGEELLVYYDEQEIQKLENSDECYLIPEKQEKLPSIFACTLCCLGFSADKCLIEHKSKCPYTEQSRNLEDIELIECHSCKIWLEKEEYREHHIPYCKESQHRIWCDYSEAVEPNGTCAAEEAENRLTMKYNKEKYQCDISSKKYDKGYQEGSNSYSSAKHIKDKFMQNPIEKKYRCSECLYQTNYKHCFEAHLNKHKGIKAFQCDVCMIGFSQKCTLQSHMKIKHAKNEIGKHYQCSECSFSINYKVGLERHLLNHSALKPFPCDVCGLRFVSKGSLTKHAKNKHAVNGITKDYQCLHCSYQTNYKESLQRHLVVHSDVKPFQCDICLGKFTQKYTLKEHIRNSHTKNERKYFKCPDCSYQTLYKQVLKDHRIKHSGIKPFQCDICLVKFIRKRCFNNHMKNKHPESETAKEIIRDENLRKHLTTNEKVYQCYICMMNFGKKDDLKIHIKAKHA